MAVSVENKRIVITVPLELHKLLVQEAKQEDRSVSNMALTILRQYFNKE